MRTPSSTYYRRRQAEPQPCERRRRDAQLTEKVREIHADSGGIYGSPRVHAVLKREGAHVGCTRVEGLMREDGLAGVPAPEGLHAPGSEGHLGPGPGEPGLHRVGTEPAVGHRPDVDLHR
ncbi:IS3 family transposase [Streptomyces sp. NPDC023838]|uniref:IS3 family transposase n=1 Tax=Streptomyces sp. NPDC023838 TaxID=3154325 RepID=UPI0033FC4770